MAMKRSGPWFDAHGNLIRAIPRSALDGAYHQGDCGADVEFLRREIGFTVPRELAIPWLRESGGWSKEELEAKDDDNLAEIVLWLFAGDWQDNGRKQQPYGLVH